MMADTDTGFFDLPARAAPLVKLTPFEFGRQRGAAMRASLKYSALEIERTCMREAGAKDAYTKGLIAGLRGE